MLRTSDHTLASAWPTKGYGPYMLHLEGESKRAMKNLKMKTLHCYRNKKMMQCIFFVCFGEGVDGCLDIKINN